MYKRKCNFLDTDRLFQEALARYEGMIHIDLGANIGDYTEILRHKASKVIAFEPDMWCFTKLSSRFAGIKDVELHNAAVGVTDGTVTMYKRADYDRVPGSASKANSVYSSHKKVIDTSSFDVRQVDFVAFLAELNDEIGIVKIDIEGAEVDVLEALLDAPEQLNRIKAIFVETHERHIPELVDRTEILTERVKQLSSPVINLYWR